MCYGKGEGLHEKGKGSVWGWGLDGMRTWRLFSMRARALSRTASLTSTIVTLWPDAAATWRDGGT